MALRHKRDVAPPDRTPMSVRLAVTVTDEYSPGVRGFLERWASIFGGMRITAGKAAEKPGTLRYPFEKLEMGERWRGALRLTGVLG
ncbi:MAG: hypothetical protein FDZ75_07065, partial [Actinobacteria bacterium]